MIPLSPVDPAPAKSGKMDVPSGQPVVMEEAKITTLTDFVRYLNDPERPRLTPEEAAELEADIKATRAGMEDVPARSWE